MESITSVNNKVNYQKNFQKKLRSLQSQNEGFRGMKLKNGLQVKYK